MNRKVIKTIIVTLILCTVIAASIGYYIINKGPEDVKNSTSVKIEAASLYTQYSKDSAGAIKKYSGRVLEVSGKVNSVSTNQQNEKVILLETNSGGAYINCTMEENPENIKTNELVNIKGICSGIGQGDADLGILGDVYLTRCFIIKK